MEGSLDDVKRVVNDLVRRNKIKQWEAGDIIKRWRNRERRRIGRQVSKQTNRSCFHCRQQGHVLADCPNRDNETQAVGNVVSSHGDGICFKCGSTEHNVHNCPRKHVK
ncbi:zinc knuckle, partial [Teladorsagia circumcincta]